MGTITENSSLLTLVNVFTVAPEQQQEPVDVLLNAPEQTIRMLPGFISANIHKSLDDVHVTSSVQWESKTAFEVLRKIPRPLPISELLRVLLNVWITILIMSCMYEVKYN